MYIETKKEIGTSEIIKYIKEKDFLLCSIEKSEERKQNDNLCVYVEINIKKYIEHNEIISEINLLNSVVYAEEIR